MGRPFRKAVLMLCSALVLGCVLQKLPAEVQSLKGRVDDLEGQIRAKPDTADLEAKADVLQVATAKGLSDLRREVAAIPRAVAAPQPPPTPGLDRVATVETRVGSVERLARQIDERLKKLETPSPPKGRAEQRKSEEKLRADLHMMQEKLEVASAGGVSVGQLLHAEVSGFPSGTAQLEVILDRDRRVREQLDEVKTLYSENKIDVLLVMAYEDQAKCRRLDDEACNTVALRRGLAVAAYIGAPKNIVEARGHAHKWGSPEENRRVIVFYRRKGMSSSGLPIFRTP
jgi:hypothetical protein